MPSNDLRRKSIRLPRQAQIRRDEMNAIVPRRPAEVRFGPGALATITSDDYNLEAGTRQSQSNGLADAVGAPGHKGRFSRHDVPRFNGLRSGISLLRVARGGARGRSRWC